MFRYFVLHKPYGVLSQFTKEHPSHKTLGDLFEFPKDVYPLGRLDKDSEGLLLISNDKSLHTKLLNPKHQHPRTYWVQVEGTPTVEALERLSEGVTIKLKKKTYHTLPAEAKRLLPSPNLPERNPPIRFRKSIPTTWLQLTLIEGKNRQVRRMCAQVGFPVLRLIRTKIVNLSLTPLQVGEVQEIEQLDLYQHLQI